MAPALCVALEVGARLVPETGIATEAPMSSLVEEDPRLGWKNRADLRARVVGPSARFPAFRYTVEINSDGLRGRPLPDRPAEGVRRIVVLGDSFPWGWGVAVEESFPALLEAELGAGTEVYNLGVPGYSTDQALLAFSDLAERIGPGVVVATVLLNDIHGNWEERNYGLRKPRLVSRGTGDWRFDHPGWTTTPPGRLRALAGRSRFLTRLFGVGRPGSEEVLESVDEAALREALSEPWSVYLPGEVEAVLGRFAAPDSVTRELLRRLGDVCDHLGARLVLLPVAHHHDQHLYSPGFEEPVGGTPSAFTRAVASVGEELGLEVLTVDGAMRRAVLAGTELNVGDGHLNPAGHSILARELARLLR